MDNTFSHDLAELPESQRAAFRTHYDDAVYTYDNFKRDVLKQLRFAFGSDVAPGNKAIKVAGSGGRRPADVLVAIQHRRYIKFGGAYDESYIPGIAFYTKAGEHTINFPKQHADNCTAKHQSAKSNFKPLIRIFKNARNTLVTKGRIADGLAPSYFIEGLLYNVPAANFTGSYGNMFVSSLHWISRADRTNFVCANEQYYLLRYSSVTWPPENCTRFLSAMIELWERPV